MRRNRKSPNLTAVDSLIHVLSVNVCNSVDRSSMRLTISFSIHKLGLAVLCPLHHAVVVTVGPFKDIFDEIHIAQLLEVTPPDGLLDSFEVGHSGG